MNWCVWGVENGAEDQEPAIFPGKSAVSMGPCQLFQMRKDGAKQRGKREQLEDLRNWRKPALSEVFRLGQMSPEMSTAESNKVRDI